MFFRKQYYYLICTLSAVLLTVSAFAQSTPYRINGSYNGEDGELIVLKKTVEYRYEFDTVYVEKGKFVFEGRIAEPTAVSINDYKFWIEGGVQTLILYKNKEIKPLFSGSKSNREYEEISTRMQGKTGSERDAARLSFIREYPNSYVAADNLYFFVANDFLAYEEEIHLFEQLSEPVKQSPYGKDIHELLTKKGNNRVGVSAPGFKAREHSAYWLEKNGATEIALSDFLGKVVLLDFWAHWCVPCRKSFPFIMEAYKAYHQDGFEVIAVNTDFFSQDDKEWKAAIVASEVEEWHHVNVAEELHPDKISPDDILYNYYVQAIPRKILIDKQGVIRGNWEGFSRETELELQELIEKLIKE